MAADGIPVTVTCQVLKIARQPYYRWLKNPIMTAEIDEAYGANALFDAPESRYRFLVDEARDAGEAMSPRTAWKICSSNGRLGRLTPIEFETTMTTPATQAA